MIKHFLAATACCVVFVSALAAQESKPGKTVESSVADTNIHVLMRRMIDDNMKPPSPKMTKLDKYFRRYCDYTGSLGLGFVASHTYDFKFRQQLKKTNDPDLKRLFVLQHLYRELDFEINKYKDGIVITGKASKRKMTPEEKMATRKKLIEKLKDLESFDPKDPEREIAEHWKVLR